MRDFRHQNVNKTELFMNGFYYWLSFDFSHFSLATVNSRKMNTNHCFVESNYFQSLSRHDISNISIICIGLCLFSNQIICLSIICSLMRRHSSSFKCFMIILRQKENNYSVLNKHNERSSDNCVCR